ncbi:hypothetical protein BGW38_009988 [Lunasporangiospora selenospora]|uniref:non-specific serine/threonine protein kinase n=1 Tax=Lunasporangiospora selenospora TaxID=979761 RepID=A0A9P6KIF4_9FUNG|nr:hypothetical protein BGW38_009988 [Lunasporangiospora selenospora]
MPQTQEYHLREEDMPTPVTPLPSLSCIFEHAAVQDEAEDSHSGRVCDQEIEEDEDEETYDDDRLLEQDHQHPERPIRESQIDRPRCHSLAAQSSIAAPDRPQSRLLASTKQPQDVKGNSTITPSAATLRKSRSAHVYFLDYYIDLLSYLKNKRERLQEFKKRPQLRRLSAEQSNSAWKEFSLQETKILRQRRTRARAIQFQILTQVGQGGFGEVFLARKTDTNELCALKRMSKRHLHLQDEVQHILTERDVLTATRSEWHVKLLYSFQDRDHVYLAMEFVPGGDIRTMLTARGVLREDETRLYFAEMVLAIDALHQQGYIHRDLKPENFLIDRTGHIKLTDFGLSKGQLAESRIAVMQAKLNEVKNSMEPTMPTLRRSGGSSILMPLTTLQGLEGAENVYSGTGAGSMLQGHLKLGAGGSFASLNGLLHRSPSHLLWNGSSSSLVPLANNSLLNLHAQAQGVNANQPGLQQQQQQQTEPHRNEGIRRAYSIVGSADYMAPEILASKGYDYGVDYWSLGCILFEFLSGYSPFQAEDTRQTCVNVWHWWKVLKRPVYDTEENLEFNLTDEAWDLTTKLIADREDRYTTVQQVKRHPWFKGLDWNNLRSMDTLFVPVLSSPIDTSYFDDFSNPEDMAGYRDVMLRQAQVHDAVLAADARSGKGAEEGPCGAEPLSLERKGLGQGGEVLNQSSGALPYILQAQEPWKGAFVGFTFRHQHPQSIIA